MKILSVFLYFGFCLSYNWHDQWQVEFEFQVFEVILFSKPYHTYRLKIFKNECVRIKVKIRF